MKVLILTQYYYPETGAPQNRLHSLAKEFIKNGVEIEVLTGIPNYPKNKKFDGYRYKIFQHEFIEEVSVRRSWIFVTRSKRVILRLFNYFSFVLTSICYGLFAYKEITHIICESPPLFLGWTGVILKKRYKAKLVFNVSDLWPESAEKLGIVENKRALNLAYKLEDWIYKNSDLVSCQTKGIENNINQRFPKVKTYWFRNGVVVSDFKKEIEIIDVRKELNLEKYSFLLLYAGVIGHAQGLELLLRLGEERPDIAILVLGDGPKLSELKEIANLKGISNVVFTGNVSREYVRSSIKACDAFIVPLIKSPLFLGAIPSKLFEPLIMSKPILLGVDGEAKELFITNGRSGLFYEPESLVDLLEQLDKLINSVDLRQELGSNGARFVSENFDRAEIAKEFLKKLYD